MDQVDATSQKVGMSADCQRLSTRRPGPNCRYSIKANKSEILGVRSDDRSGLLFPVQRGQTPFVGNVALIRPVKLNGIIASDRL